MKTTVTINTFTKAFETSDRQDQFSYDGLRKLFNYLENEEDDLGIELELDVIGLCCQFTEYMSLDDIAKEYKEMLDLDDASKLSWLHDRTTVILFDTGIIIENF